MEAAARSLVTTVLAPLRRPGADALAGRRPRPAGLLAVVGHVPAGRRGSPGRVAGVVAAGLLLLTPDGGPRFLRLVLEGHTRAGRPPRSRLWAVERHLAGRRTARRWSLATALALDRPEAWPFLGLYARLAVAARAGAAGRSSPSPLAVVPVLWFGADWWGSGAPLARRRRRPGRSRASRADRLGSRLASGRRRSWWPRPGSAAAAAVVTARRRRERALLALGAASPSPGCGSSCAMTVALGYAALSRFFLPAAALLCVLAGVGPGPRRGRRPAGGPPGSPVSP